MSLQTNVTSEYLRKAFEFSVDYYLNPNKVTRNRAQGQERRIGQIIDDFITGKVIELGVVDILKEMNPEKEFLVDLDVHDNPEYEDPDIVGVNDNNSKRKPNVFIEIKNDARENRWTGLFEEQFETMKQHDLWTVGIPHRILTLLSAYLAESDSILQGVLWCFRGGIYRMNVSTDAVGC